ncbi:MerR family transcriptional regulator [Halomonas elongata]|uniref:MerR family transcriptional regulator n=1 Tax=Halomonas elongata TaxID=2746 RepID=UPI00255A8EAF|nr:MerR family transcriptional regulator [Halomonas elongata]MDL4863989.1 MerR family transcriptional regulator [Halomonas elongata]
MSRSPSQAPDESAEALPRQQRTYSIGELARMFEVTPRTIRFYEQEGLLAPSRQGQKRIYREKDRVRLKLTLRGKRLGFSLAEIRDMLGEERRPRIDRDMLSDKADALDRHIEELSALRDGLRHAASCTAPSHLECPTFQRLMRIALARQGTRERGRNKVRVASKSEGSRRGDSV